MIIPNTIYKNSNEKKKGINRNGQDRAQRKVLELCCADRSCTKCKPHTFVMWKNTTQNKTATTCKEGTYNIQQEPLHCIALEDLLPPSVAVIQSPVILCHLQITFCGWVRGLSLSCGLFLLLTVIDLWHIMVGLLSSPLLFIDTTLSSSVVVNLF